MNSAETDDGIMYSDVTTQGEKTFYSKIGDLLGWFCVFPSLGRTGLPFLLYFV